MEGRDEMIIIHSAVFPDPELYSPVPLSSQKYWDRQLLTHGSSGPKGMLHDSLSLGFHLLNKHLHLSQMYTRIVSAFPTYLPSGKDLRYECPWV